MAVKTYVVQVSAVVTLHVTARNPEEAGIAALELVEFEPTLTMGKHTGAVAPGQLEHAIVVKEYAPRRAISSKKTGD